MQEKENPFISLYQGIDFAGFIYHKNAFEMSS